MSKPLLNQNTSDAASHGLSAEMVLIPAGRFQMGAEGWGEFERPVHTVELASFWLDITPVTNRDFIQFAQETGYITSAEHAGKAWGYKHGQIAEIDHLCWRSYAKEDRLDHPVILVSWHDAQAFAQWAGKRLPTEAEWEYAARGGHPNALYPWGNTAPEHSQCQFGQTTIDAPPTAPARHFSPNAYGLYHMAGNVWNWCLDWFGETYYSESPLTNPPGPARGVTKVRRGGSFNIIQPFRLRCANRGAYLPHQHAINIGFRCAKSL